MTPLERALVELARKTCEQPARLAPSDLDPVRSLVADGALDYTLVLCSFHFINRIADLLHVDPEALPTRLRRFELLRRLTVRVAALLLSRMDLANRECAASYEEALARAAPALGPAAGGPLEDQLEPLRSRPKLIEAVCLAVEERDTRSSLDRATVVKIHRTVERALPDTAEEAAGFHPRPPDPVEAFAFVGTRYAYRTTHAMIRKLHDCGYGDLRILDLAVAVADANQWARFHRLLGLSPGLFYLG